MSWTVDFDDWMQRRRAFLPVQTAVLQRRHHRGHRPRTDEDWEALGRWVAAELARRERSGRWIWVDDRTVEIS